MSLPAGKIKARVGNGSLPAPAGPRIVEKQGAEIARVVRCLEDIVSTHSENARRMHPPLMAAQVVTVLDALRAEAHGVDRTATFAGDAVTACLQRALYEELVEEPSNVFYSTRVSEDVMRFEPLPRDFWLACLDTLQTRLPKQSRR